MLPYLRHSTWIHFPCSNYASYPGIPICAEFRLQLRAPTTQRTVWRSHQPEIELSVETQDVCVKHASSTTCYPLAKRRESWNNYLESETSVRTAAVVLSIQIAAARTPNRLFLTIARENGPLCPAKPNVTLSGAGCRLSRFQDLGGKAVLWNFKNELFAMEIKTEIVVDLVIRAFSRLMGIPCSEVLFTSSLDIMRPLEGAIVLQATCALGYESVTPAVALDEIVFVSARVRCRPFSGLRTPR